MPQAVPEEKKRKRDKFESESEADEFHPEVKVEVEQQRTGPYEPVELNQVQLFTNFMNMIRASLESDTRHNLSGPMLFNAILSKAYLNLS